MEETLRKVSERSDIADPLKDFFEKERLRVAESSLRYLHFVLSMKWKVCGCFQEIGHV